jgi:hypothetical protein
MADTPSDELDPAFAVRVLNEHGYAFHYAALRHAMQVESSPFSPWIVTASELPVNVNGKDTRVDFVLRHKSDMAFMVIECKRVNPAFTDWCFFRAPFIRADDHHPTYWFEHWERFPQLGWPVVDAVPRGDAKGAYHIALSLKGKRESDKCGSDGRQGAEEAFTQVMRHSSGFLKLLSEHRGLVPVNGLQERLIIPAVFTTARLWACEADLSLADLESGRLDPKGITLKERPWIAFQYHTSQGLRPLPAQAPVSDLGTYLAQYVIRTIFVVNTSGIHDFLQFAGGLI